MTPGQRAATAALGRATAARQEAEDRTPEVAEIARQLRQLREQNHFAESMYMLFEGGR